MWVWDWSIDLYFVGIFVKDGKSERRGEALEQKRRSRHRMESRRTLGVRNEPIDLFRVGGWVQLASVEWLQNVRANGCKKLRSGSGKRKEEDSGVF